MNLENFYANKEKDNLHNFSRSNYIEKHMKDASDYFKKLILKTPEQINMKYFKKFFNNINEEIKQKIINRLKIEGLIDKSSDNIDGVFAILKSISGVSIASSITIQILIRTGFFVAAEAISLGAGFAFIPVAGWILGGITGISALLYSLKNFIGIWKKENAIKDISKGLFDWFISNRGKLLDFYISVYDNIIEQFIGAFSKKKEIDEKFQEILDVIDKYEKYITKLDFELKDTNLLEMIKDEELQKFIKQAINYELNFDN